MKFRYVITGDDYMALAVHSEMPYDVFKAHIRKETHKIHPKGRDTVWRWGIVEFINPTVLMSDDFVNGYHALI
jgi:hypothetical protein